MWLFFMFNIVALFCIVKVNSAPERIGLAKHLDRMNDESLTLIDRVFPPHIIKYNHTTTYGGSTRYGPGNHEGDPAYDRTQSFNGFVAGLGIGVFPFGTGTGLGVNAAHPHEALEFDVEGFNKELQSQVQGAKYGMDVWNSTNDGESGEDWSKYKMHSSEETEVDKLHIFD